MEDERGALNADMATALEVKTLEEVLQHGGTGILVAPGEIIARLMDHSMDDTCEGEYS